MNPKIKISVDTKNKAATVLEGMVTVGARIDLEVTGLTETNIPEYSASDKFVGRSLRVRIVDVAGSDLARFPLVEKDTTVTPQTDGDKWSVTSNVFTNDSGTYITFDTDKLRAAFDGVPYNETLDFGLILDSVIDNAQYAVGKIKVRQWAVALSDDPTILPDWRETLADLNTSLAAVNESKSAAAASATSASQSATAASANATSASASATAALGYKNDAASSASIASTKAEAASSSAAEASNSASAASASASAASAQVAKYPKIDDTTKHWLVWNASTSAFVDTGVVAEGEDGISPHIGYNGNWYVGTTDTGVKAKGDKGDKGDTGPALTLDDEVTQGSDQGVKSSGIWRWVKGLLPSWLTSTYIEPATVIDLNKKIENPSYTIGSGVKVLKRDGNTISWSNGGNVGVETDPEFTAWRDSDTIQLGAGATAYTNSVGIGSGVSAIAGYGVALGYGAECSSPNYGVAIGAETTALGTQGAAVGHFSKAIGEQSIALGSNSKANAEKSVALGDDATADHPSAVAIGPGSVSHGDYTITLGQATSDKQTSPSDVYIGGSTLQSHLDAKITNPSYSGSDAKYLKNVGGTISWADGGGTIALDDNVTESSANGVKSSGIWTWVKGLLPSWLTSSYAEPATVASVNAKITNPSYSGTDAKYLKNVGGTISWADGGGGGTESDPVFAAWKGGASIAAGYNASATGECAAVYGSSAGASGAQSSAFGYNAQANSTESTAIGRNTTVDAIGGTAFGNYSTVHSGADCGLAIGNQCNAYGDSSVAIGSGATAGANSSSGGDGSLAIGNAATATHESSIALGRDSTSHGDYTITLGQATATHSTTEDDIYLGSRNLPQTYMYKLVTATLDTDTGVAAITDRAINSYAMSANTELGFPTAVTGRARDFIVYLDYTSGELTLPSGITKIGDTLSFTAGKDYLVAFTEVATSTSAEGETTYTFYVRSIQVN